ncbi:DUF2092 domain-containing protein [Accumulibacter sp.]|uniref:DUF2092 domain-containing protein n=1 Tax=Accumulibacter sp. TaxID=2053492 RepID=UPI0028C44F44|nr:DUF2092 domain-containing protein [Accumulibacter sp.]
MKQDSFPTLVIAVALLAIPAYSGAQQAAAAAGKAAAVTPKAATAAPVTPEAAKAASGAASAAPSSSSSASGQAATLSPEAATSATAAREAGQAAAVATDAAKPVGAAPATPSVAPTLAPEAAAALKRTSDFLQTLKAFNVRIDSRTDEVLASGQKVQFGSLVDVSVVKPDRLRVDVVDDDQQRQFYYDGQSLALYGKAANYYASVAAPDTIIKVLAFAETKYGMALPVADLLAPESLAENVKSGTYLGKGRVRGQLCDHYAFRQDDVDWQIWIQEGKTPLPRRIVITTKNEQGAPQHQSVLSWNLSPKVPDSAFHYFPPKSARRIVFREVEGAPDSSATFTSINRQANGNANRSSRPGAPGVAIAAAAAVTAAEVGSMGRTLPANCVPYVHRGLTYQQCGGAYYQPQFSGGSLVYMVVDRPG